MTWTPTPLRRHLVVALCRLLEPRRHRARCYAAGGPPPMLAGCLCALRSVRARAVLLVGRLAR